MDARDFKKFSFVTVSSPATWGVVLLIAIISVAVGLASETVIEPKLMISPILFAIGFLLVNLFAAFLIDTLVKGFKAKWGYFIALLGQILFVASILLFRLSVHISFIDSMVLWSAVTYTMWMLSLTGLGSLKLGAKSVTFSLIQPALVLALIFMSVQIVDDVFIPLALLAGSIVVSTLILLFNEHMFSLVFAGISGMAELSKFFKGLRGEQVALEIGHNINALLQYLIFKANGEKNVLVAPWLHSGPIRSVGGGNLSTQCIEELNNEYADSYFLHVPSSHQYNPSGKVAERVVDAIGAGEYAPLKVSDVVRAEKNGITALGQRFNDVHLISLSSSYFLHISSTSSACNGLFLFISLIAFFASFVISFEPGARTRLQ